MVKSKFGTAMLLYNQKNKVCFIANSQLKSYLSKVSESLPSVDKFFYKDEEISPILKFVIKNISIKGGKQKVDLEFIRNNKSSNIEHATLPLDDSDKSILNLIFS